jgi:hypothetical protein
MAMPPNVTPWRKNVLKTSLRAGRDARLTPNNPTTVATARMTIAPATYDPYVRPIAEATDRKRDIDDINQM